MKIRNVTPVDGESIAELDALSKSIPEEQLPLVLEYALADKNSVTRTFLSRLLIDRGDYDGGAKIVIKLFPDPQQYSRKDTVWRWWEFNFNGHKNYKQMGDRFSEALLKQFEKGDAETKAVVADIFGLDASSTKLTAEKFRAAVKQKKSDAK